MCAAGFPIGTNNCTWRPDFELVKAIDMACFRTVQGDPNYPNGWSQCGNYNTTTSHLVFAMQNCPDVKDTLPWPDVMW
jgi:hypothetical protein